MRRFSIQRGPSGIESIEPDLEMPEDETDEEMTEIMNEPIPKQTARPIPEPLYPCSICREDCSWPAEDLHWSETAKAWVCNECWDFEEHGVSGISLAKELGARMVVVNYDAPTPETGSPPPNSAPSRLSR